MTAVQPISTEPVHSKVYDEIKKAITSARFKPGEVVTIRGLADALGTSSMPVREALRRLITEGALEALPNRSLRIPLLDRLRAQEIIDIRIMLEGEAAARAALKITPQELEYVEKSLRAANALLEEGDIPAYLAENRRFHFAIYRAARNETMLPLIESLWLQYAPTHAVVLEACRDNRENIKSAGSDHHRNLCQALAKKDAEGARKAVTDDIVQFTMLPGFKQVFEA